MDSNVLIRVFDTELNYLGQVDDYESLIFRRKWSGYGEFEITLGYCSPILQARRFILLDEDPKRSGCIEYVQYDEAKGTYTVKGFSLLKLLETRITVPPKGKANQSYQGTPAEIECDCTGGFPTGDSSPGSRRPAVIWRKHHL